jgi:hypothetical protein
MAYGTLMVGDLIRSSNQNILNFGQGDLYDYLTKILLPTYEQQLNEELDLFSRPRPSGSWATAGRPACRWWRPTRAAGPTCPSRSPAATSASRSGSTRSASSGRASGSRTTRPRSMMAVVTDVILTDTQNFHKALKNAFFGSTNYAWIDHLIDGYSLSVKGWPTTTASPTRPTPTATPSRAPTTTTSPASRRWPPADIDAVINTVAEHYNRGQVRALHPLGLDATIRGVQRRRAVHRGAAVTTTRIATTVTIGTGELDTAQINNRRIGYWGNQGAEVWVKPWVPANYMLAFMTNYGNKVASAPATTAAATSASSSRAARTRSRRRRGSARSASRSATGWPAPRSTSAGPRGSILLFRRDHAFK